MRVISLFSGCGGLDLGLEHAGHTIALQCEIDRHARSVLRRHWPDTPLHDDVTTLNPSEHRGRIDLVAGGSPCQDLSVAGRRAGLDGARSGLFWHQCRVARESSAPWVLWENVVGALSSNDGADFAAVLWGLCGALPGVPADGWRGSGVIVGPDRVAVWRVLDAQYLGVAQRRRRVFVVAGPRDRDVASVLLEPESVSGDPPPSRASRLDPPVGALCGTSPGGGHRVGPDEAAAGICIPVPVEPLAVSENQRGELRLTDYAYAVTTGGGKPGQGYPAVLGPAYPIATRGRDGGSQLELGEPDVYNTLRAGDGGSSRDPKVLTPAQAVRRLTPRECERLMSYPDDWTRYADTGAELGDGPRYRLCGNGVVSNVAEWIGRRLAAVEAAT